MSVILRGLTPSYLRENGASPISKRDRSTTSHIDGLRGLAAFLVMLSHCAGPWYQELRKGYAPGERRSILQLPILRLICHGSPMVTIFFLLSGLVLSIKPLRLARQGDREACLTAISSAVLRRGPRLFLPPLPATFAVAVLVQLNCFNFPYHYVLPVTKVWSPEHFPTVLAQLWDWLQFVLLELTNPFAWTVIESAYDVPLWTIPIDFVLSMRLFLFLAGVTQLRFQARLVVSIVCCIYYTIGERWFDATFFLGTIMAEIHLINLRQAHKSLDDGKLKYLREISALVMFVIGLHLCSYPEQLGEVTPGFIWLSKLTNRYRHWESIGAVLLVWAVDSATLLTCFFNGRVLQYLGRISYALYVVHVPIFWAGVFPLQAWLWRAAIEDADFFFSWRYYAVVLPSIPVVLWVADLYWQYVDEPCTKFSSSVVRRFWAV